MADIAYVDSLVERILDDRVDILSEEELLWLLENKQACRSKILSSLSEGISQLLENEEPSSPDSLYWSLQLAGYLEEPQAFAWIQKLFLIPPEEIDTWIGFDFITEDLKHLLAATAQDQWEKLQQEIENSQGDEFMRKACLDALVILAAKGRIKRSQVIAYFQHLLYRILQGDLDDDTLATHLVVVSSDMWPGECLEEIRELFGLDLVDTDFITIDDVYMAFSDGKPACLEELKTEIEEYHFLDRLLDRPLFPEEDEEWEAILEDHAKALLEKKPLMEDPGRNDPCPCNSGRKYKKCCMNTSLSLQRAPLIEESVISYEPIYHPDLEALPAKDRESILELYHILDEDPKTVLEQSQYFVSKYPHIPLLYNFLYNAYCYLDQPLEVMQILRESLEKFPDYLFGKIEYASYLLRRGEPEKVSDLFSGAKTLSQLYPERKVFHVSEWKGFCYIMGRYFLALNQLDQAKIYLQMLEQIVPESPQYRELKQQINRALRKERSFL